jgi:heptosyltransferase-1
MPALLRAVQRRALGPRGLSVDAAREAALLRRRRALARRRLKRRGEGLFYGVLGRLVRLRPRPPRLPPRRVLLLLRGERRGDAVVSLAFSAAVREAFPEAELRAAGPPELAAVFACDASVTGFHALPRRAWRQPLRTLRAWRELAALDFDLAFVLGIHFWSAAWGRLLARHAIGYDYNGRGLALDRALTPHVFCNRSGWEYGADDHPPHITEFWRELLADASGARPEVSWRGLELAAHRGGARAFLERNLPGGAPLVAFHPYATERNRSWPLPLAERFLERLVGETDWRVVLTGARGDRENAERLAGVRRDRVAIAAGMLSLGETWALLAEAGLLVSIDTSLVHMAAAAGTPVVALFGPSDPLVWGPHGQGDGVLQANEWCQRCKRPSCVHPGVPCMEALAPEAVLAAARRRLRGGAPLRLPQPIGGQ